MTRAMSREEIRTYRQSFQARLERKREAQEARRQRALESVRKEAPAILSRWPCVHRAYLFGSITRPGAFHKGSDVDIAVEGVTAEEYLAVWRALERALPDWAIDLRDITPASTFADLVRRTGVLIYAREHTSAAG
jgi:predicted nucleotidyltransferase